MHNCQGDSAAHPQRIIVFQQFGSGEKKISALRQYGGDSFSIEVFSIDVDLPPVIDESGKYLPTDIDADLVLDFLKHPDLSQDLAALCEKHAIPVVASGKKVRGEKIFTPPT